MMTKYDHNCDPLTDQRPLVSHLTELRNRILKSLAAILIVFLALLFFAKDLYHLLALPLLKQMAPNSSMIAIEVAAPFLVPFKLTLFSAIFITIPYLLAQIWGFVVPGLYCHEQRLARPLLISSVLLFYAGVLFAYFVIFPLIFKFFQTAAPQDITIMTDIGHYLDFILKLFFAFGLAFEVPVATVLLILSGTVSAKRLSQSRSYIIIIAFIMGMLLTPPDVVSQILLALPIWLLFEIGLLLGRQLRGKP